MTDQRLGRFKKVTVGGEQYSVYLPSDLSPALTLEMEHLIHLLDKASTALGRLDGMTMVLPDPMLFLYMYVRKEAVLSSQIEGTQSSLSDLLLFEIDGAPGAPIDDITEVSNYVAAMEYGLERLKDFPLSLRLIREIHLKLMSKGRGSHKQPGEFRTSQNWIGGTRPGNAKFVPPPPEQLMEFLGPLEKFLHNDQLPPLLKAALAHVQFESIHPFLDGNGRLGRLLITFILCSEGVLKQPLLYLSLYFKTHRDTYYELLQQVRVTGDWEAWVKFFLTGVIETANQATRTAQSILALFDRDRHKIEHINKPTLGVMKVYDHLKQHPITNTTAIRKSCPLSLPTILRSLASLQNMEIVQEVTGKDRHKIFVYGEYLSILNNSVN